MARMPSCPLPPMDVWPLITSGCAALGETPVRSTLIPRPALPVKAPSVIESGDCVATPSADVLRTLLRVIVRFCATRGRVGVLTEIPVTAYRTSESVNVFALPGSRMRAAQSPAATAGHAAEILGTKTEPQLARCGACSLRLLRTAPVARKVPLVILVAPR